MTPEEWMNIMSDGSLCTYAKEAGIIGDITNYDVLDEIRMFINTYIRNRNNSKTPNPILIHNACVAYAVNNINLYRKNILKALQDNTIYKNYGAYVNFDKVLSEISKKCKDKNLLKAILAIEVVSSKNKLNNPNLIDGRFSDKVKKWAIDFIENMKDFNFELYRYKSLCDESHTVIINSLIEKIFI